MDLVVKWARQYRGRLALISVLSLVGSVAVLAVPWLAGQLVGEVVGGLGPAALSLSGIVPLLVVTLIVLTVTTIAIAIMSAHVSGKILADLRQDVFAHLLSLPASFHDQTRGGDTLSLMTRDVSRLSNFLTATLAQFPALILTALGAGFLLVYLDPILALLVPVLIPAFFVGLKLLGRRQRAIAQEGREAEAEVLTKAYDAMEMIEAIKAFATEQHHLEDHRSAVEKARVLAFALSRINAFTGPISALFAALGAIGILILGSSQLGSGRTEPGELFAFLLYAALLTRPVGALASAYGQFQIASGALARLRKVFEADAEPGHDATLRIGRVQGAITFEQVSFSYPGRSPLLEAVDLSIAPGEIIALTGENGIGKSTLIKLMLRFYEPTDGRITIDGQSISEVQVQDVRRQFGYVPQRPALFGGSIRDNIAFGLPQAEPAAIERAARMAQAWDFIERLPQGLATRIGDAGVRLSGGQRQRIALARALLLDPPIYIFDEATSMYDLEGEAAFVEACIQSLKGRTVIIITHRPASLALADRIIGPSDLGYVLPGARDKPAGRTSGPGDAARETS